MTDDHLFVYGLLRAAAAHELGALLQRSAHFVSTATFRGKLYLIDDYPGVIPSSNPKDIVHGDLYRMPDVSLLSVLDGFEGVGPAFDSPNEYQRTMLEVSLSDGTTQKAWVYCYNWSVDEERRIYSGDFLTR